MGCDEEEYEYAYEEQFDVTEKKTLIKDRGA